MASSRRLAAFTMSTNVRPPTSNAHPIAIKNMTSLGPVRGSSSGVCVCPSTDTGGAVVLVVATVVLVVATVVLVVATVVLVVATVVLVASAYSSASKPEQLAPSKHSPRSPLEARRRFTPPA